MIHKKRNEKCLNCGSSIKLEDNFCYHCGQENTTYKLTFSELLRELVDSTFNLNTKFFKSLIPFLIRPGKLTLDFLSGKRKSYIHPIRFYILISILFFFVIAFVSKIKSQDLIKNDENRIVSRNQLKKVIKNTKKLLASGSTSGQLDSVKSQELSRFIDTINVAHLSDYLIQKGSGTTSLDFAGYHFNWNVLIYDWAKDSNMTPSILLDSMNVKKPSILDKIVAKKLLQYAQKNNPNYLTQEIYNNIPVMMFLLLPVFAIFLKLLYIRRKRLYIEHLVFALYIHAHVYLTVIIVLLGYYWSDNESFIVLPILIEVYYSYKMFKNVYRQNWFKTWSKMCILGIMYLVALSVAILLEVLVSLLTF